MPRLATYLFGILATILGVPAPTDYDAAFDFASNSQAVQIVTRGYQRIADEANLRKKSLQTDVSKSFLLRPELTALHWRSQQCQLFPASTRLAMIQENGVGEGTLTRETRIPEIVIEMPAKRSSALLMLELDDSKQSKAIGLPEKSEARVVAATTTDWSAEEASDIEWDFDGVIGSAIEVAREATISPEKGRFDASNMAYGAICPLASNPAPLAALAKDTSPAGLAAALAAATNGSKAGKTGSNKELFAASNGKNNTAKGFRAWWPLVAFFLPITFLPFFFRDRLEIADRDDRTRAQGLGEAYDFKKKVSKSTQVRTKRIAEAMASCDTFVEEIEQLGLATKPSVPVNANEESATINMLAAKILANDRACSIATELDPQTTEIAQPIKKAIPLIESPAGHTEFGLSEQEMMVLELTGIDQTFADEEFAVEVELDDEDVAKEDALIIEIEEELAEELGILEDINAMRAEISGTASAAKRTKRSGRDDLCKINGIGNATRRLLRQNGIASFEALADAEIRTLWSILRTAGGDFERNDPTAWPEQAALAAKGQWDLLEQFKLKQKVQA